MTPITPMEAYATTDGKLHMDAIDAQAHQHGLDIRQEIEEHLGDYRVLFDGYTRMSAIVNWEVSRKLKQLKEQNV